MPKKGNKWVHLGRHPWIHSGISNQNISKLPALEGPWNGCIVLLLYNFPWLICHYDCDRTYGVDVNIQAPKETRNPLKKVRSMYAHSTKKFDPHEAKIFQKLGEFTM